MKIHFNLQMSIQVIASTVLAVLLVQKVDARECFDGVYTGTSMLGGYTHSETDVVSTTSAAGYHTFTAGSTFGSFQWEAALTVSPSNPQVGSLSGTGVINNAGIRYFSLSG